MVTLRVLMRVAVGLGMLGVIGTFAQSIPRDLKKLYPERTTLSKIALEWRGKKHDKRTEASIHSHRQEYPKGIIFKEQFYDYDIRIEIAEDLVAVHSNLREGKLITDTGQVHSSSYSMGFFPPEDVKWSGYFGPQWWISGLRGRNQYDVKSSYWHGAFFTPILTSCPSFANPLFFVFLMGLSPLELHEYPIQRVETRSDRWVLHANSRLIPGRHLRLEVRKSDGLPLLLEEWRGKSLKLRIQTLQTQKIGAREFPSKVHARKYFGDDVVDFEFTLTGHQPLEEVKLNIPSGAKMLDGRLVDYEAQWQMKADEFYRRHVSYAWSGHLLSKQELKQLALQQGRLLPEEAPSRRYSVVLFLPAVLFFAGALYLYWRQRRR